MFFNRGLHRLQCIFAFAAIVLGHGQTCGSQEVAKSKGSPEDELWAATSKGHISATDFLLDVGSVCLEGRHHNDGGTVLVKAAESGYANVVERLIIARANLEAETYGGMTSLLLASLGGHTQVITSLLSAGANLSAADPSGWSALHFATTSALWEDMALQKLLDARADVNTPNKKGETPIILAAGINAAMVIQPLIDAKANLHLRDAIGRSALTLAQDRKFNEVTNLLLQAGGDSVGSSVAL